MCKIYTKAGLMNRMTCRIVPEQDIHPAKKYPAIAGLKVKYKEL